MIFHKVPVIVTNQVIILINRPTVYLIKTFSVFEILPIMPIGMFGFHIYMYD